MGELRDSRAVLCVEDDEASFFLIQIAFEQTNSNARLFRVRDGAEALAFIAKDGSYANAPKPALMLLNLNMPVMNRFKVLGAMQHRVIDDIPTVVFSSSSLNSDKAPSLAL